MGKGSDAELAFKARAALANIEELGKGFAKE
jgi:hypothetical protein